MQSEGESEVGWRERRALGRRSCVGVGYVQLLAASGSARATAAERRNTFAAMQRQRLPWRSDQQLAPMAMKIAVMKNAAMRSGRDEVEERTR